jgi:hypothetical protein
MRKKHMGWGPENGSNFSQFYFSSCDRKQYYVPEEGHPFSHSIFLLLQKA